MEILTRYEERQEEKRRKAGEEKERFEAQYEPFTPLFDRVVCRRIRENQEEVNGIVIPQIAQKENRYMEVIAVGDGVFIGGIVHPMPVKPGDLILSPEYGMEEWSHNGEDVVTLRAQDIRGVMRKK